MELQTLKASTRETTGKGHARRMRSSGYVPAVLYGGAAEPVSVRVETREFQRLLHAGRGEHAIIQLDVQDNPAASGPALLKEVQRHPVRGDLVHADFQRISLDERITTLVSVVLTGRAAGVAEGGVLDLMMREVEVECRALEVPEHLELDVTELGIGDSLKVSALTPPANVAIVSDPERTVVAVHASRLAVAEEAGAEGEEGAAEPEVIGKKEEEGE